MTDVFYNDLINRAYVLWDFDGVLYSYHTVDQAELKHNFWSANASGACELVPFLTFEEAYKIGGDGFLKYHDTLAGFLPYATEIGLGEVEFKQKLLQSQLRHSYKNITQNLPELIEPCAQTNELFTKLSAHLQHVMITHSHRDCWAIPVADHLGVREFFDEILGYEELEFQNKGKNAFAIEKGLQHLNAASHQAIFLEDQVRHLEVAKEAYPDIFTVLIEGAEPIEQPNYVDMVVKRPKDFLEVMTKIHVKEKVA